MRIFEIAVAGLFLVIGSRSLWKWSRRPLEGTDVGQHLLYAAFLTGRIGLWFSFAGLFLIYASVDARGRAAIDEVAPYRWYVMVPISLSALQLIAGYMLGRRSTE